MMKRKFKKPKNKLNDIEIVSKKENDIINQEIKNSLTAGNIQQNTNKNKDEQTQKTKISKTLKISARPTSSCRAISEKLDKAHEELTPKLHVELIEEKPSLEIQSLTGKLVATRSKLFEALNQNRQIKNDLKIARKCIKKEIGEHINFSSLLTSKSSWRGRAQQIAILQEKITDLKKSASDGTLSENVIASRKTESIWKIEFEKKSDQLRMANETIQEQKTKINSLKTRSKILNDENNTLRQNKRDMEDVLRMHETKFTEVEKTLNQEKLQRDTQLSDFTKQLKVLSEEKFKIGILNSDYQAYINELNDIIQQKNKQIGKLNDDLKAICGDFLFECKDLKANEFMAIVEMFQKEKDNLLEHIKLLNTRLDNEQNKFRKFQDEFGKVKLKNGRLVQANKKCLKEKEQLEGRTKRNRRISGYSSKLATPSNSVMSVPASSIDNTPEKFDLILEIEDLKNKLEVATEKIVFLEDNINNLQLERKEDTNSLATAISKSKYFFLNQLTMKMNNGDCNL